MIGNNDNAAFLDYALCDCDWDELVRAADEAGLRAARELAERCRPRELGRPGSARVRIEPVSSPVASWLHQHGHAWRSADGSAVLVPMRVRPEDLGATADAAAKAASVLTRRAYADAYCAVLAEEAGVTATPEIEPDRLPPGRGARTVPAQSAAPSRARSRLPQQSSRAQRSPAPPPETSTTDTST